MLWFFIELLPKRSSARKVAKETQRGKSLCIFCICSLRLCVKLFVPIRVIRGKKILFATEGFSKLLRLTKNFGRNLTENELILRLRERDEIAFKELVSRYQDRVFNTALGLLQHHADAEDIAQEVFIQVYHSISGFEQKAALTTWIYRITVTKSLDHLRTKKRKRSTGFLQMLFGRDNQPVHEPEDFNHPGVKAERKEDAALLFKMVDQLPGTQRTAFILNKVGELSYKEIAGIMNTTEPAVDALLQRAKQNLRKKLNHSP